MANGPVIGFIAGFLERLVPDLLERTAATHEDNAADDKAAPEKATAEKIATNKSAAEKP